MARRKTYTPEEIVTKRSRPRWQRVTSSPEILGLETVQDLGEHHRGPDSRIQPLRLGVRQTTYASTTGQSSPLVSSGSG